MSRHPEADLLNSLTSDPKDPRGTLGPDPKGAKGAGDLRAFDPQSEAIEEVLACDDQQPVSVVREMHQRMKAAAAQGRAQREGDFRPTEPIPATDWCRSYSDHRNHHRREGDGWVCDRCEPKEKP